MWEVAAIDILPASVTAFRTYHPFVNLILTEKLRTVVVHGFAIVISLSTVYMIIRTLIVCK